MTSDLPRAKLFWLRRRFTLNRSLGARRIWWAKFRNANAMFVWIGPLEIGWRMPWLDRPRRAYEQMFAHQSQGTDHDR